ncbi:MAG: hypothetical protein K2G26_05960 [Clostridia bacterium]|nr:hypothetical protein [Clostridia bacterium]
MVVLAVGEVKEPEAEPLSLLKLRAKVESDISATLGTRPLPFASVRLVEEEKVICRVTSYANVGITFVVFASALTLLSNFKNEKTAPHNSATQNMGVSI